MIHYSSEQDVVPGTGSAILPPITLPMSRMNYFCYNTHLGVNWTLVPLIRAVGEHLRNKNLGT